MNTELMFSSKSDEWETPQDLFDKLNEEFHFTLDPCATHKNHKCDKYYTKEDGLIKDWTGETVFCNPPYGKAIGKWVEKCYKENLKGVTVVMLIPARTDTSWFHKYIYNNPNVEIRFLKGRLKFVNRLLPSWNENGEYKLSPVPFPSMVVVFNGGVRRMNDEVKMQSVTVEKKKEEIMKKQGAHDYVYCPECGAKVIHESGCVVCQSCGWGLCG